MLKGPHSAGENNWNLRREREELIRVVTGFIFLIGFFGWFWGEVVEYEV